MGDSLSEHIDDAVRFWERGRLAFNIVLAVVALWTLGQSSWAHPSLVILVIPAAAIAANIGYSLLYLPDIVIQHSALRQAWCSLGRPSLWLAATAVSAALTFSATLGTFVGS